MTWQISVFHFLILIASIIVHEVAHGLMAEREGDPTARMLGRITLNPLKHLDWVGSVLVPLLLIPTGFVVGWAKPVPYVAENLRHGRRSEAKVAIAGIVVNMVVAIVCGLVIRVLVGTNNISVPVIEILSIIVIINIVLAIFNSIPLAPLDGFRFLSSVLPWRTLPTMRALEQYSLPILVLLIVLEYKFTVIIPFAYKLYSLLTGIAL